MSLTKQEFSELVAKAGAGTLTEEEAAALEPYRTRNAVILAAGTCRRFAPISFDYPKPLVEVRGEVLVERQIRQLLSVGITDITLVVGFMKEKFDYLVGKYGVSLVENANFPVTNTIVSLAQAADRLGNTYILLGDQFYTVNPFERFVYRSFYASTLSDTDDAWVVETDPDGVVTDMIMSADGGEKLQGPCYVDAECGAALATALGETLTDATAVDKYWEYAWYLNRDKLNIVTRYYPAGVVNSFKTMDELYAFDDSYLLHVESEAMDNICGYLGCAKEDLHDFEALMAGLTNYNVAFTVGEERYVYRHPIGYAPVAFDRAIETYVNGLAHECGVDPTFIYEDPKTGWKLCHYIKGARQIDRENRDDCTAATKLLATFQRATKGVSVDAVYDRWEYACNYERQIASRGFKIDDRTMACRDGIYKVAELTKADNWPLVLSHNDCWYANYLYGEDGTLNLIDWEYAAMSDPYSDLAYHVNCYYISVPIPDIDFGREQLRTFLGRDFTLEEWRHFWGLYDIVSWRTAMWVIDFVSASDAATDWDVDAWLILTWLAMEQNSSYVISLYEDEEAQEKERAYMKEFFARA